MFVRAVRFTDVDPDRLREMLSRIEASDGPPEGVKSPAIQILVDSDQSTVLVLQHFESMDDLRDGEAVLGAMDSAQTPGTRASVDRCELKLELKG